MKDLFAKHVDTNWMFTFYHHSNALEVHMSLGTEVFWGMFSGVGLFIVYDVLRLAYIHSKKGK